ncbi:TPA: hypothetical protein ACNHQ5_004368 [Escherichia coli]|jgi:hypothetical protein
MSRRASTERPRPNRIYELTQKNNLTYADVAERVRQIAKQRKDKTRQKVHEITINRLATGAITLTQDWMNLLAEVYAVSPTEILAAPLSENIIRVRVTFALEAKAWSQSHQWKQTDSYEIMIPEDSALDGVSLYAGELRGPSCNEKYPEKSVMILSTLKNHPGEIAVGRRYHVRVRRPDGLTEETIKRLYQDDSGKYWLRPESNHPDHQTWLPLDSRDSENQIELVGRVRGVYTRED